MSSYSPAQQRAIALARTRLSDAISRQKARRVTIDFETRSRLDLSSVGAYKYSQDPSTRVLMMSYCLTGDPKDTRLWLPGMPPPQALFTMLATGAALSAFNSYFEYCIWKNVCVARMGWQDIAINQTLDVADKCKALALPAGLEEAAQVLKVANLKDSKGKALINLFCKPNRKGEFNEPWDFPQEWDDFKVYCVRDTKAEVEIDNILPDLPPFEQNIAWLTMEMNWRGIYLDMAAVNAATELVAQIKEVYNEEASKLSGGLFKKCTQRAKVKDWLESQGVVLPNLQGKTVDVYLRKKDIKPQVRRMLQLYKVAGSSSVAKFDAMAQYVAADGRVHELLNYHKARTGRWGGKGIQIQNFPRPKLPKWVSYEEVLRVIKLRDVKALDKLAAQIEARDERERKAKGKDSWWLANSMEVLVSSLRAVICSMVGRHMKSADYSAIEARVLLWLAGDDRALDIFRRGEDIYLDMASAIYNVPLSSLDKESDERPLGKETILGAGYGMGEDKFRQRCEEVANIIIDKQMAKKSIQTYRKRFPLVPKLWAKLEIAAIEAVRFPGRVTKYLGIRFKMDRYGKMPILLCRFPSGHTTGYPYAQVKLGEKWGRLSYELVYQGYHSKTKQWCELSTYGGKLTENVTQGVARDLMAFGMLLLDCIGYYLIMTVHDEAASEDEDGFGSLKEFEEVLCTLPSWAEGLPVTSEGWEGPRYRK